MSAKVADMTEASIASVGCSLTWNLTYPAQPLGEALLSPKPTCVNRSARSFQIRTRTSTVLFVSSHDRRGSGSPSPARDAQKPDIPIDALHNASANSSVQSCPNHPKTEWFFCWEIFQN